MLVGCSGKLSSLRMWESTCLQNQLFKNKKKGGWGGGCCPSGASDQIFFLNKYI